MSERIDSEYATIDYAARRRDRARERGVSSRTRYLGFGALAVVGLVALAIIAEALLTAGRVHPGVSVVGVSVGGMRPENAVSALKTDLPAKVDGPVVVVHGDQRWEIAAQDVGLTFDYERQVDEAMQVGRSGGFWTSVSDRLGAWVGGIELEAQARADDEKMARVLSNIAKSTDLAAVNATVRMKGTEPTVVDGKVGRGLERDKAAALVLAAFTSQDRTVEAPVSVTPMAVDANAAEKAAETARRMVSEPVRVAFEKQTWQFSPEQIARWLVFKPSEPTTSTAQVTLDPIVSPKAARSSVTTVIGADVGRPARDARFRTSNGRVTIEPSQEGIGPDVESLARTLTKELADASSDRRVELRTKRTQPKVTTEKARTMGIKERIGTYTTTYESGNRPRVNNIHLLGDSLDGTLIAPGGVFSFNGTAGERTAEKGYQEANAIVNGKLVPQLGGGVCQVGTTVFNAVFESGLPVVERRNHSFYISHYPKGRDATVSWGGPDLKFKNDTKHWVLVSVSYTPSSITVSLYGTDPGYEVSSEESAWSAIKPFGIEQVKDPEMPKGSRVIEDAGISGRSITVKRIVSKDGKVVRTDTFVSNYKPKDQVVRVGTKQTASKTTTPTP